MTDEKRDSGDETQDTNEDYEAKPLPKREMMSLISADPADPMYSSMIPPDATPFAPVTPGDTLPIEGPNVDGAEDSESASTSVQDTDSASAES